MLSVASERSSTSAVAVVRGVKAVRDDTVGDGDGELRLAGTAGAAGDEAVAVRHGLGAEDS